MPNTLIIDVVKIILPSTVAFVLGIGITPFLSHYLYKYKFWKKKSVLTALDGKPATITASLHRDEEKKTPRMGGIVIWASTALTVVFFSSMAFFDNGGIWDKLSFLSRNQTWIPLFTLIVGAVIGFVDDMMVVSNKGGYVGGGLPLSLRIGVVTALGIAVGWWFYSKLGVSSIHIPFDGDLSLGYLFIPFFVLVMLAIFSGGVVDGIDGLSGGIMTAIFSAYGGIAFFQNQIDLAAFCFVVAGATLAFLWFNIPPARFYMSETGMLGLTTSLTAVAFLTKAVLVLPIIALPLFLASGSVIVQMLSKKFRNGKKVFLVAPLHHHFEAIGWPAYKVTMRFWVVSAVCALFGMVIALVG